MIHRVVTIIALVSLFATPAAANKQPAPPSPAAAKKPTPTATEKAKIDSISACAGRCLAEAAKKRPYRFWPVSMTVFRECFHTHCNTLLNSPTPAPAKRSSPPPSSRPAQPSVPKTSASVFQTSALVCGSLTSSVKASVAQDVQRVACHAPGFWDVLACAGWSALKCLYCLVSVECWGTCAVASIASCLTERVCK